MTEEKNNSMNLSFRKDPLKGVRYNFGESESRFSGAQVNYYRDNTEQAFRKLSQRDDFVF